MRWTALWAFVLIGCHGPRASEPIAGPTALNAKEKQGQIAFMRSCNSCHPGGEGGVGGSLNDKPAPGTVIKAKVRGLVPGDMPSFSEQELSDGDLEAITEYLKTIRKKAE